MMNQKRITEHPFVALLSSHIVDYPTATNLNYMWGFGSLAGITLVIQLLSGLFLSMHYCPQVDLAFASIEYIMRDIHYGWFLRYMHANGASFFFLVVIAHVFRGLFYGSYVYPRQQLWLSGVVIYLLLMATAFMGYVLPWSQMGFWGLTVITSMFSIIPFCGEEVVTWLWGGYVVTNVTLNRFYTFHFVFPFILVGFTLVHLALLHKDGSNNPLGLDSKAEKVPFYPYYYVKDLFGFCIFLGLFATVIFYYPTILLHGDCFVVADYDETPRHIVPEWYFLPFYGMLKVIPHKTLGIVTMGVSIIIFAVFPFLETSVVRSSLFRPISKSFLWFIIGNMIIMAYIGQCTRIGTENPKRVIFEQLGQFIILFNFFIILVVFPLMGRIEGLMYKVNSFLK